MKAMKNTLKSSIIPSGSNKGTIWILMFLLTIQYDLFGQTATSIHRIANFHVSNNSRIKDLLLDNNKIFINSNYGLTVTDTNFQSIKLPDFLQTKRRSTSRIIPSRDGTKIITRDYEIIDFNSGEKINCQKRTFTSGIIGLVENNGDYFLATASDGLYVIEKINDKYDCFRRLKGGELYQRKQKRYTFETISSIEKSAGIVYIGTNRGLYYVNKDKFLQKLDFDDPVSALGSDSEELFIVTHTTLFAGTGVRKFPVSYFQELTSYDSIYTIQDVEVDPYDNIWMLSNNIIVYERKTGRNLILSPESTPRFGSPSAHKIIFFNDKALIGTVGSGIYQVDIPQFLNEATHQQTATDSLSSEAVVDWFDGTKRNLKSGQTFSVPNLYFVVNKTTLEEGSEKSIENLFVIIREIQETAIITKMEIHGHTSEVVNEQHEKNRELSQERSQAVKKRLREQGFDFPILTWGHGDEQPLDTLDLRNEINRRVEIIIDFHKSP